jgi:hypothetical protein
MLAPREGSMATEKGTATGTEQPSEAWARWADAHKSMLERATASQQVLLEATVRFIHGVSAPSILIRLIAFFLLHADMALTSVQVGAAVGRTDRAMRTVQALSAHEVIESLWAELRRHRQPKLRAEHAGPIAKYLVDHPRCTQTEVVAFIARDLKITIDPQTLHRFLGTYGLEVLRPPRGGSAQPEQARPFSLGAPTSGAPSCCCRPPSP